MWFFVDETWPPNDHPTRFGVLFGLLVADEHLIQLDRMLYAVRKKYFGEAHARDLMCELKGSSLLSNYTFRLWAKNKQMPQNVCVVKEVLSYPLQHPEIYFKTFSSIVYGDGEMNPDLIILDPRNLERPFSDLVTKVSRATRAFDTTRTVKLIFDERLSQRHLATAVRNYVGGMKLSNVHPTPYFANSNACSGIQIADILAFLVSKRAQKEQKVMSLYNQMIATQWEDSNNGILRYGYCRYDEKIVEGKRSHIVRKKW